MHYEIVLQYNNEGACRFVRIHEGVRHTLRHPNFVKMFFFCFWKCYLISILFAENRIFKSQKRKRLNMVICCWNGPTRVERTIAVIAENTAWIFMFHVVSQPNQTKNHVYVQILILSAPRIFMSHWCQVDMWIRRSMTIMHRIWCRESSMMMRTFEGMFIREKNKIKYTNIIGAKSFI